jgi:hypothetical protein
MWRPPIAVLCIRLLMRARDDSLREKLFIRIGTLNWTKVSLAAAGVTTYDFRRGN